MSFLRKTHFVHLRVYFRPGWSESGCSSILSLVTSAIMSHHVRYQESLPHCAYGKRETEPESDQPGKFQFPAEYLIFHEEGGQCVCGIFKPEITEWQRMRQWRITDRRLSSQRLSIIWPAGLRAAERGVSGRLEGGSWRLWVLAVLGLFSVVVLVNRSICLLHNL